MDEPWVAPLAEGQVEAAWDAFLGRYRPLIFSSIRRYAQDYDDVMDVFVHVCEALRRDDLRRLRSYAAQPVHRAGFSTWLVTVVRHLAVDWFRRRDGRPRLPAVARNLPTLQRRIYELVFVRRLGHVEAYETLRSALAPDLTFRQYLAELRSVYRVACDDHRGGVNPRFGRPALAEEDADATLPVDEASERHAMVDRALATLSPRDRVAVELYVMQGLSAEDVASAAQLPNSRAVYNRTRRAVASLRTWARANGVEPGTL